MRDGKGIHAKVVPGNYRPVANKDNDYLMDRAAQKAGRTYSGVEGFAMQDASLQESMGPIVDRTKETLVSTDSGIIIARQRLLRAVKAFVEDGVVPPGVDLDHQRVRSAAVCCRRINRSRTPRARRSSRIRASRRRLYDRQVPKSKSQASDGPRPITLEGRDLGFGPWDLGFHDACNRIGAHEHGRGSALPYPDAAGHESRGQGDRSRHRDRSRHQAADATRSTARPRRDGRQRRRQRARGRNHRRGVQRQARHDAHVIVRAASATDEALSKTLAQVRPWSLMVVVVNDDDYVGGDPQASFR